MLFEAAVEKRLMAERRIGCLLSGTFDILSLDKFLPNL
jgi:asparagine synthetase B (glutamine-hydrolysing)